MMYKKKKEIWPWMTLKDIIQSGISQSQKNKYYNFTNLSNESQSNSRNQKVVLTRG